eukprot:scaffold38269_cov611-Skeletonema_dohrnii-CCMP3373.AAC.2
MSASDPTDIVKFLVSVDKQGKECASKCTSNKTRIKRIMEGGSLPWTSRFDPEYRVEGNVDVEPPTAGTGSVAAV